jgi:hypothetical protein
MGQKTPSVSLRLGLHRKWSTSWFSSDFGSSGATPALSATSLTTASVFNNTSSSFTRPSPVVVPRGGQLRSGREERLFSFFCRRPFVFSSGRSSFSSSASVFSRLSSPVSQLSADEISDLQIDSPRPRSARRRSSTLVSAPLSAPHRFYPVDLHIRVGSGGQLFIFFIYAKLLGRAKGALLT